jgi:hypothetical protein
VIARFKVAPEHERIADGILFASKKEMRRYLELKTLERAGKIYELQLQPAFKTYIQGKLFCTYTADFSYWINHKQEQIVEDVKSTGTAKDAAYRLRKKAAELTYGFKVTEVLR